jgi:hypothetical protein
MADYPGAEYRGTVDPENLKRHPPDPDEVAWDPFAQARSVPCLR